MEARQRNWILGAVQSVEPMLPVLLRKPNQFFSYVHAVDLRHAARRPLAPGVPFGQDTRGERLRGRR